MMVPMVIEDQRIFFAYHKMLNYRVKRTSSQLLYQKISEALRHLLSQLEYCEDHDNLIKFHQHQFLEQILDFCFASVASQLLNHFWYQQLRSESVNLSSVKLKMMNFNDI